MLFYTLSNESLQLLIVSVKEEEEEKNEGHTTPKCITPPVNKREKRHNKDAEKAANSLHFPYSFLV